MRFSVIFSIVFTFNFGNFAAFDGPTSQYSALRVFICTETCGDMGGGGGYVKKRVPYDGKYLANVWIIYEKIHVFFNMSSNISSNDTQNGDIAINFNDAYRFEPHSYSDKTTNNILQEKYTNNNYIAL